MIKVINCNNNNFTKKLTILLEKRRQVKRYDTKIVSSIINDIKKNKNLQFKTIDDPQLIDKLINERNAHHLNQAQGTHFTIKQLLSLIGQDSFTSFSQELLDGTADLDNINVSPLIKQYLTNLRSNDTTLAKQTGIIPLEDFKAGYKKWHERTTTSPSGRYLGHYHALLAPDGNDYSESKNFSDTIWQIYHSITTITLLNEKPLLRWLTSIVILLPKDAGQPKIHRLRIINTYESEYNLILKYFWANKGMRIAEKKEWLGDNQTGGRKGMSASETAVINEIILDIH